MRRARGSDQRVWIIIAISADYRCGPDDQRLIIKLSVFPVFSDVKYERLSFPEASRERLKLFLLRKSGIPPQIPG